jgi:hypothetical protein
MRLIAKMLITCFCCVLSPNVKCDREMRLQIFFLQRYFCEFVLVIMLNHFIVYVSTVWLEFFRDDECFTRMTHQTRRKRLIKLDTNDILSDLMNRILSNLMNKISSNLMNKISSNLTNDISFKLDERHLIKLDEWYLIKFDKRYFIKLDENFVCSLRWAFLNDKRKYVKWDLTCYTRMSIEEFWEIKTDFL